MKVKQIIKIIVRPFFLWAAKYVDWIIAPVKTNAVQLFATTANLIHPSIPFNRKMPVQIGALHWKFLDNAPGITKFTETTFFRILSKARVLGPNGAVVSEANQLILELSPEIGVQSGAHSLLKQIKIRKPFYIKGFSFLLTGPDAASNYFHWMTDALPRMEIAMKSDYKISDFNHFIVNAFDQIYQKESLAQIGIPENCIISLMQSPYLICEKLLASSPACLSGNVSPWIIDFLRGKFSRWMVLDSSLPIKIYINRKNAGKRRLRNEDEVAGLLNNQGYVSVTLEELSITEQIKLFYNAASIIGVHGAGFTNLIFCKPQTKIIEFFPDSYVNQCYWTIASNNNLKYGYVIGKSGKKTVDSSSHLNDSDFEVSIKDIYEIQRIFNQGL